MHLIVSPNSKGSPSRLAQAAEVLGWSVYQAPGSCRVPENLVGQVGTVYGEQIFCELIATQMHWRLHRNSINWLAKLPKEYIHREITFTNLAVARTLSCEKFIAPADLRSFPARVYTSGSELPAAPVLSDLPVLISDPVAFTSKYRCFVKDRQVVSVCCYWYEGEFTKTNSEYAKNNDKVIEFVDKLLENQEIECVPAVIDVGRYKLTKNLYTQEWPFVIINSKPAYCSEIYHCEMVGVLETLKAAVSIEE